MLSNERRGVEASILNDNLYGKGDIHKIINIAEPAAARDAHFIRALEPGFGDNKIRRYEVKI